MNIEDVKDNQLWIFYEEDFDESYMQEVLGVYKKL